MESFVKNFLDNPNESNGSIIVNILRIAKIYNTAILIGQFISNMYPDNIYIKAEIAINAFYSKQYKLAYDLYSKLLESPGLTEKDSFSFGLNRNFSINYIADDYIGYDEEIVKEILERPPRPIPLVTFSITTCKRFDLFEKTMNSFLKCCTDRDKIDKWLCVDDNSSIEDREKMKEKYPFFTFYLKSQEEKGHPQSMNIIRNLVKTEYIFHMEDDWKYFYPKKYITECMGVLGASTNIGQCLINRNYAETSDNINIVGGIMRYTKTGIRFYEHEYTPNEESRRKFTEKYNSSVNCSYWPHFSFRPSLLRKSVLDSLGPYNESVSHFEMEYSYRYVNKGFISVFLDGIYCLHTGRLTSQRNDKSIPNAYDLNGESQFFGKEEKQLPIRMKLDLDTKAFVVNLDRRSDRLEEFNKIVPIDYDKFSAIDGKELEPTVQLQQIFEHNDYNMRVGLVGCALSHIKLLIELVKSDKYDKFIIMEDDITFVPNFNDKLTHVMNNSKKIEWDIIYLGHSLREEFKTDDCFDKEKLPVLEKWNTNLSLRKSMGGFFGYIINKQGASKILKYIEDNGMTNGIDTVQQKAIDLYGINTYYCYPHLIYTDCVMPGNNVNSDIQREFDSLTIPYDKRIEMEKDFYGNDNVVEIDTEENLQLYFTQPKDQLKDVVFYTPKDAIFFTKNAECFMFINKYFIEKTLVMVLKDGKDRYFSRLKKNDVYNIDDAIIYKKSNLEEHFEFFKCKDQMGFDCYREQDKELCVKKVLEDEKCVGFNTLGFCKTDIKKLENSPYFSDKDGIYIKKDFLKKCKIVSKN